MNRVFFLLDAVNPKTISKILKNRVLLIFSKSSINSKMKRMLTIVKFINAEATKCATLASPNLGVVSDTGATLTGATAKACEDHMKDNADAAATVFKNHFIGKKFKNPFKSSVMATADGCSGEGCTLIESDGTSLLTITTEVDGETLKDEISLE